jgi:hypothetical protein
MANRLAPVIDFYIYSGPARAAAATRERQKKSQKKNDE